MKYFFILVFVLLTSCVKYEYVDGESMYECGVVIGGETRGAAYWLWIEFPDGQFWYEVTQKAYYEYKLFDDICFGTLNILTE
jgi:hypothetical protein